MGEKEKLTDWPDNLKDIIDWFLRVAEMDEGGTGLGNQTELPAAVKALGDYESIKEVLDPDSIAGTFGYVAEGLRVFIGYDRNGMRELDGSGIGLDTIPMYASSYKTEATWNNGWKANDSNSQTCAHILLCSMPLLYYGLTFVYWMCTKGGWREEILGGGDSGSDLHHYLLAMSYSDNKIKSSNKGHDVMRRVESEIDDLQTVAASHFSSYPQFLEQLKQKGTTTPKPIKVPLYKLFAAASKYLQSKVKPSKIMELPQTKSEIAKALKGYSEAIKILNPSNAQKLSTAYNTLLSKIKDVFHPDSPAPPSSSAAAAAGGVLGTAALGGTAAALATNVGGITTTLTNFIPIFK
ncbi:variant erythrocyte surface antigen-1 family protein [Babesia caballi]|uniref:Variant erythrocyte surface antigen-1 family protein n=1 Tax=Babesia caballi TaxID=5871 RepID=A0AAV4LQ40_BABCB|nr:variant erythrocyte surface antigen-1 family protein [Babesia caballi]